mmetsp:Transcript_77135/g.249666  ORF Transcript_77135/g.249666 Transcript_77135/m.249666 type:complete len:189 (+) Transcript_77135:37-603(+)
MAHRGRTGLRRPSMGLHRRRVARGDGPLFCGAAEPHAMCVESTWLEVVGFLSSWPQAADLLTVEECTSAEPDIGALRTVSRAAHQVFQHFGGWKPTLDGLVMEHNAKKELILRLQSAGKQVKFGCLPPGLSNKEERRQYIKSLEQRVKDRQRRCRKIECLLHRAVQRAMVSQVVHGGAFSISIEHSGS